MKWLLLVTVLAHHDVAVLSVKRISLKVKFAFQVQHENPRVDERVQAALVRPVYFHLERIDLIAVSFQKALGHKLDFNDKATVIAH